MEVYIYIILNVKFNKIYLGAYIDQNLHWGAQIQHKNKKLMKNVGIINKLRYTCKTRLRKIKTKQNKCVRSLFFAYSRDNAMPYFNLLEIITLENIYKFKVALSHIKLLTMQKTSQ